MAIDTAAKRRSAASLKPIHKAGPIPDGTIAAADRLAAAWLYSGIAADAGLITLLAVSAYIGKRSVKAISQFDRDTDEWTSPDSHNDPDSEWSNEANAYDGDTGTKSQNVVSPETWSGYLELLLTTPMVVDKIRHYSDYSAGGVNSIDIDVYYEGAWQNLYQGTFADQEWESRDMPDGAKTVSKARVRYYNVHSGLSATASLFDFQFGEVISDRSTEAYLSKRDPSAFVKGSRK